MRTKEQIEGEMLTIQKRFPQLDSILSSSTVSFFGLLKAMWVFLVQAIEQQLDSSIAAAVKAQAETKVGSLAWYVKTVKAFQFGDAVTVYDNLTVGYGLVSVDKQIIKQAAITEQPDGRLLAKVAKVEGTALGPLSEPELIAVKDYVRQTKYAGVVVDVISLPADELRINVKVKYDRQVLNSSGQLLTAVGSPRPVDEAVKSYIKNLPFDSAINWTLLTDALQKVPGVLDFQITASWTRAAGTTAWNEFTREATSRAGHMKLSTESVFTYV